MLVEQYSDVKAKIIIELGNISRRVSITCDIWSDTSLLHAYLGITLHYYKEDVGLKRIFLGLVELKEYHTADLIRSDVSKLLLEFNREDFNPIFLVAAALDPNNAEYVTSEEELTKAADTLHRMLLNCPISLINEEETESAPLTGLAKLLAKASRKKRAAKSTNCALNIESIKANLKEVGERLEVQNPIGYWDSALNTIFRSLATLAIEILAITATSAPIERVFSQARLATSRHRSRTEILLLNSQLVIYENS